MGDVALGITLDLPPIFSPSPAVLLPCFRIKVAERGALPCNLCSLCFCSFFFHAVQFGVSWYLFTETAPTEVT